jgi:hypothetical protein
VTGGVVLGQAVTVPDDTRALLRQLLTATDKQGLFKQMDDSLGSVAPLVAALLALFGIAAAAETGRTVIPEFAERVNKSRGPAQDSLMHEEISKQQEEEPRVPLRKRDPNEIIEPSERINWRAILGLEADVVVWLRSGKRVGGTIEKWYPENAEQNKDHPAAAEAILRLKNAELTVGEASPEPMKFVLIPVADIELIAQSDPSRAAKTDRPRVRVNNPPS